MAPCRGADLNAGRCTGHCCKRFTFSYGPDTLIQAGPVAQEALAIGQDSIFIRGVDGLVRGHEAEEIAVVADMLVFLEEGDIDGNGDQQPERSFFYTCRHLQPDGNCGNYDGRPKMCRDFPYRGQACEFKGCTYRPPANASNPAWRTSMGGPA